MSNFVVKVVSSYKCTKTTPQTSRVVCVEEVKLLAADSVSIHKMPEDSQVDVYLNGNCTSYMLFHKPMKRDDWMEDGGVITAIYVENPKGRTVFNLRRTHSEDMLEGPQGG
jgi:hypothetical protein